MARQATVVVQRIKAEQIAQLAAIIAGIGVKRDSKDSFPRIVQLLKRLDSDAKYKELKGALTLKGESVSSLGIACFLPQQINALACAVTPWGAENFDKVLEIARFLSPTRWGIGFATQIRTCGFRDESYRQDVRSHG
jgi:hypothetical protein